MHSKTSHLVLLPLLLFSFSLFFALVSSSRFDPENYTNSTSLSPKYTLHWKVDLTKQVIYFAFEVYTNGWVGFGLAEETSGSMPGSDMILGYVKNGQGFIQDSWSSDYVLPSMDSCQNWILENVYEDEKNSLTVIEVSRDLYTNDTQDRHIAPGLTRIVWAFGSSDNIGYHGSDRGFTALTFYGQIDSEDLIDDDQSLSQEFLMSGFHVPPQRTTYVCEAFRLPFMEYGPAHVIKVDPVVYPPMAHHVHHFFIHSCYNISGGFVEKYFANPHQCYTPTGDPDSGCISDLYAWAMGGDPLVLPPQAGFMMNNSLDALQFLIVEVHYDNPDLMSNLVDYSGIRVHWTQKLRQYEAGVLMLADYTLSLPSIPPRVKAHEVETSCPSECTSQWKNDIVVFQDFLHMHEIGSMMWSTHWDSNNNALGVLNRIEYYAFDHQHTILTNRTIKRGDRINTHCVWDSTSRSESTKMGLESEDEMCIDFLYYYPALTTSTNMPYLYCIYLSPNLTACGNYDEPNFLLPIPQPSTPDPQGGVIKQFGIQNCKEDEIVNNNKNKLHSGEVKPIVWYVSVGFLVVFTIALGVLIFKKKDWIASKLIPIKYRKVDQLMEEEEKTKDAFQI